MSVVTPPSEQIRPTLWKPTAHVFISCPASKGDSTVLKVSRGGKEWGGAVTSWEGRKGQLEPTLSARFLPHLPTNQLQRSCSNMKALGSRMLQHNMPQFPKLSNRMMSKIQVVLCIRIRKGMGSLAWRTTTCVDREPWKDGCGFLRVEKQQSQGDMTERMGTVKSGIDLHH